MVSFLEEYRWAFALCVESWRNLPKGIRIKYAKRAKNSGWSAFNLYIKEGTEKLLEPHKNCFIDGKTTGNFIINKTKRKQKRLKNDKEKRKKKKKLKKGIWKNNN
jgi:hypothetical protein